MNAMQAWMFGEMDDGEVNVAPADPCGEYAIGDVEIGMVDAEHGEGAWEAYVGAHVNSYPGGDVQVGRHCTPTQVIGAEIALSLRSKTLQGACRCGSLSSEDKSTLANQCVKKRILPPVVDYQVSGEQHAPQFRGTFNWNGITMITRSFSTKGDVDKDAAHIALNHAKDEIDPVVNRFVERVWRDAVVRRGDEYVWQDAPGLCVLRVCRWGVERIFCAQHVEPEIARYQCMHEYNTSVCAYEMLLDTGSLISYLTQGMQMQRASRDMVVYSCLTRKTEAIFAKDSQAMVVLKVLRMVSRHCEPVEVLKYVLLQAVTGLDNRVMGDFAINGCDLRLFAMDSQGARSLCQDTPSGPRISELLRVMYGSSYSRKAMDRFVVEIPRPVPATPQVIKKATDIEDLTRSLRALDPRSGSSLLGGVVHDPPTRGRQFGGSERDQNPQPPVGFGIPPRPSSTGHSLDGFRFPRRPPAPSQLSPAHIIIRKIVEVLRRGAATNQEIRKALNADETVPKYDLNTTLHKYSNVLWDFVFEGSNKKWHLGGPPTWTGDSPGDGALVAYLLGMGYGREEDVREVLISSGGSVAKAAPFLSKV